MNVEITEQDVLNFIDDICGMLDSTTAVVCRRAVTARDKLNVLNFAVNTYRDSYARDRKKEELERRICALQLSEKNLKQYAVELEKENKELKNANYELEKELCTQSETIEEHLKKIETLNRIVSRLEKRLEPRTLSKNKHAYKKDVNPADVFWDIKCGMTVTKAAEKYNVSRETIRKRYKEWEKELYGGTR